MFSNLGLLGFSLSFAYASPENGVTVTAHATQKAQKKSMQKNKIKADSTLLRRPKILGSGGADLLCISILAAADFERNQAKIKARAAAVSSGLEYYGVRSMDSETPLKRRPQNPRTQKVNRKPTSIVT